MTGSDELQICSFETASKYLLTGGGGGGGGEEEERKKKKKGGGGGCWRKKLKKRNRERKQFGCFKRSQKEINASGFCIHKSRVSS